MTALLRISGLIDAINDRIGRFLSWFILAAVVISTGNAIMRKAFSIGSNAYLEIQWYLFAAVFMLSAGYLYMKNGHVRIDFLSSRLSIRANAIIDALSITIFVIPLCLILIDLSWPLFVQAWDTHEMSQNAGGLPLWPVRLLIPAGFSLLLLQSVSELIKRVAYLAGKRQSPMSVEEHGHGAPDHSNDPAGAQ